MEDYIEGIHEGQKEKQAKKVDDNSGSEIVESETVAEDDQVWEFNNGTIIKQ